MMLSNLGTFYDRSSHKRFPPKNYQREGNSSRSFQSGLLSYGIFARQVTLQCLNCFQYAM